ASRSGARVIQLETSAVGDVDDAAVVEESVRTPGQSWAAEAWFHREDALTFRDEARDRHRGCDIAIGSAAGDIRCGGADEPDADESDSDRNVDDGRHRGRGARSRR